MKREFCVVDAVCEDHFILKNAMEERYRVDAALLGGFRCGDEVLLIYTDRQANDDGTFTAAVESIFPDCSILQRPVNGEKR